MKNQLKKEFQKIWTKIDLSLSHVVASTIINTYFYNNRNNLRNNPVKEKSSFFLCFWYLRLSVEILNKKIQGAKLERRF